MEGPVQPGSAEFYRQIDAVCRISGGRDCAAIWQVGNIGYWRAIGRRWAAFGRDF